MKYDIKILEKMGQTQSIHQYDTANQMFQVMGVQVDSFTMLKNKNNDLVCLILPDDDDEE